MLVLLHAYHGTCISGSKAFGFPSPQICTRPLGPGCLVNYLPRRCGGWSPLTMVSGYVEQRRRQTLLTRCDGVATLSEHMRQECIAQGVAPAACAVSAAVATASADTQHRATTIPVVTAADAAPLHRTDGTTEGRPCVSRGAGSARRDSARAVDRHLRRRWPRACAMGASGVEECLGANVRSDSPAGSDRLQDDRHSSTNADLLVVPSLWPEPYGLVGPEAAAASVPALAFDVGGIREWLIDSETGRLAQLTS